MPDTPPNHDYPIRVLMRPGRDWYAYPSEDPPGDGEVVWWARRVSPWVIAGLDAAWLDEGVGELECDYEPGSEREFANWDDALVERTVPLDELRRRFRELIEACYGSYVMELAPGLDPETGRREGDVGGDTAQDSASGTADRHG